jgi:hypothetical protein
MFKLSVDIPDWEMLSDQGNKKVNQIVNRAKRQKLSWPQVFKELWILHNESGFVEAMDKEVTKKIYKNLNFKTPFYFYGVNTNGKTLFDVFPELEN